jgi:hypothetical protein
MADLRVNFVDFWPNFIKDDNYFYHLLKREYDVVIDEHQPDILFHSVDYAKRQEHLRFNNGKTIKVFYTGECVRPDFTQTHYAFCFDYSDDQRIYRLPLWVLFINWFNIRHSDDRDISYLHSIDDLLAPKNTANIMKQKTKFCSFIASAPRGKRLEFVPKIQKYKHIDCAGKLHNNMPVIPGRGDQKEKIKFLEPYKFNISFENESYLGYVTEKIVHSMFSGSIPIYWGSPRVHEEFNNESFINAMDYKSDEELIADILKVDRDKELYIHMLSQPWFKHNTIPEYALPNNVLGFIKRILR